MSILITGGLGFIGSNLARRLLLDDPAAEITLLDSLIPQYGGNRANVADLVGRVRINISDLRDSFATRELLKGVDLIFNLAAQTSHADSMIDPFTDLDINAKAQLALLEGVRDVCPEAVVVFTSTRQIYGRPRFLPVDETHPIRPVDVNGVGKVAGEQFHLLYHDVYGLRTTCLRLTNTYGPGMRIRDARQTFLGIWIRNLLESKPVQVFGDGMQRRDFNHVDDVVHALILASQRPECFGQAFNLGSDEVVSLLDLATMICELVPAASWELVPFPAERKAIDIGDYFSNYSLATELLGWTPQTSLADGLSRTLDYYRARLQSYL